MDADEWTHKRVVESLLDLIRQEGWADDSDPGTRWWALAGKFVKECASDGQYELAWRYIDMVVLRFCQSCVASDAIGALRYIIKVAKSDDVQDAWRSERQSAYVKSLTKADLDRLVKRQDLYLDNIAAGMDIDAAHAAAVEATRA